ncbi:hypothetical protein BHM03_00036166, partial [Ensete ventricosum]
WSITHRVHNPYSEYAPENGLHLLVDGKSTLMRRYDKFVACSSFSGGFSLRSELSPRCDLLGLGDRPNLNSAKRAHSLSSIRISKASNLVPIRSIDALAGYDGQGLSSKVDTRTGCNFGGSAADEGSAAGGDDDESAQLWELLGKIMGNWMTAVKVEEQQGAKNAALVPRVRTPQDSKHEVTSVGNRPSLELYRGSPLFSSRPQWLKKINILLDEEDGLHAYL